MKRTSTKYNRPPRTRRLLADAVAASPGDYLTVVWERSGERRPDDAAGYGQRVVTGVVAWLGFERIVSAGADAPLLLKGETVLDTHVIKRYSNRMLYDTATRRCASR